MVRDPGSLVVERSGVRCIGESALDSLAGVKYD
jgi:hypothetical protein